MGMTIGKWRYLAAFVLVSIAGLQSPQAQAASRHALVVGNGDYVAIGRLKNASSDAQLMADTLRSLNFEVSLLLDSSQQEMKQQIADFGRNLRAAKKDAVGFFFYAGHGIQASGRNYLLPIEATPTDQADLDLMGVEANWILRQMESAGNRTNIIVLDACRNNPFTTANRSLGRGLAQIDAPTGSFISYSTAPGKVALDGAQANSPFTQALAKALLSPGIGIEQVFKKVRREVISITDGAQTPWDSSSLIDDFYANPLAPRENVELSEASTFWQKVRKSEDPNRIALFLQAYPKSEFVADATELLSRLLAEQRELEHKKLPDLPESDSTTPRISDSSKVNHQMASDRKAFALALEKGTEQAYQTYLRNYPGGVFVSLVKRRLAELQSVKTGSTEYQHGFDQPWSGEKYNPEQLSLRQLTNDLALYPPYKGLSVKRWATITCTECHDWTKRALCTQGRSYIDSGGSELTRSKHPYGGFFKRGIKVWASQGCK